MCRANKLRAALGGEAGTCAMMPARPKGMYQSTDEAKLEELFKVKEGAMAEVG